MLLLIAYWNKESKTHCVAKIELITNFHVTFDPHVK